MTDRDAGSEPVTEAAEVAAHEPDRDSDGAPEPGPVITGKSRRWRRRLLRAGLVTGVVVVAIALASQVYIPATNPAFMLTHDQAAADIREMGTRPTGIDRPVVIISGWRSPSVNGDHIAGQLIDIAGAAPDQVVSLSDPWADDINAFAADVVDEVERRWPSDDPRRTTEVDVIAISMGGLVARTAALAPSDRLIEPGADSSSEGKALRIGTLYTFASPHRGSRLANIVRIDTASKQMFPESDFMANLNDRFQTADYDVVPYAVLHDRWVGATRASPPGQDPIWVSGRIVLGHHLMTYDNRLMADLLRRVRNESPVGFPSEPPRD